MEGRTTKLTITVNCLKKKITKIFIKKDTFVHNHLVVFVVHIIEYFPIQNKVKDFKKKVISYIYCLYK